MLSKRKRMFADYSIFNIIPRGLTARIAGFHPAGPGSTPGVGNTFLFHQRNIYPLYHSIFTVLNQIIEVAITHNELNNIFGYSLPDV